MNAAAFKNRVRGMSPTRNRQVRPSAVIENPAVSLKGDNLFMEEVVYPGEAEPGEFLDFSVTVSNGAFVILSSDPDRCTVNFSDAYTIQVAVDPAWTDRESKDDCLQKTEIGVFTRTYDFRITAPRDPGTYRADVELIARGSGESGSVSVFIDVVAPPECTSNADCGAGEECQNGSCVEVSQPECTSNADCGAGEECQNGECVTVDNGGNGNGGNGENGNGGNGNGGNGNGDGGNGNGGTTPPSGGSLVPCFLDPDRNCGPLEWGVYGTAGLALTFVAANSVVEDGS